MHDTQTAGSAAVAGSGHPAAPEAAAPAAASLTTAEPLQAGKSAPGALRPIRTTRANSERVWVGIRFSRGWLAHRWR